MILLYHLLATLSCSKRFHFCTILSFFKGVLFLNLTNYEIYHEDKSHTSPEFPYNTYLCSIPLDFSAVNMHWHEEAEIIVIKKGMGIISVDLTEYEVQMGDIVFVMSGQLHAIRQLGNNAMEYENILFKPSLLRSGGCDLCWESFLLPMLSANVDIPAVIGPEHAVYREIAEAIGQIDRLCDTKPTGYQLAVKGHLYLLLYHMHSQCRTSSSRPPQKHLAKLKTILSYVEAHYAEPITIEEMAGVCFYSKSYFMKFFKQSMGIGFIAYLNDFRLEIAARMLLSADANILDIGSACGFENLSYFNRSFKKKYGVTPGRFRKK